MPQRGINGHDLLWAPGPVEHPEEARGVAVDGIPLDEDHPVGGIEKLSETTGRHEPARSAPEHHHRLVGQGDSPPQKVTTLSAQTV
jgi:hypothetical protein